ncbi:MAG: ATP-binding cassette domain-containing protein [Lachnospiraceae bacterium]|nr:ATP-binding cassette domain-containing protein [Lachnospiraceae bacterium]
MSRAIEIRNVSAAYGSHEVLRRVSLDVERGEFLVIIGPSGCGKTTLLKLINGLVLPAAGEVLVEGERLSACSLTDLRKRIGYAVQGAKLFPHMTVQDNICYVPCLDKKLSKEDRRVMAASPDILLMDEPFGAVDEITRRTLQGELSGLQKKTGITIVFITHDIEEAFKLGSRILIMKDGMIWQEGGREELLEKPRDAFVKQLLCGA